MHGVKPAHLREIGALRLTQDKKRRECAWEVIELNEQVDTLKVALKSALQSADEYKGSAQTEKAARVSDKKAWDKCEGRRNWRMGKNIILGFTAGILIGKAIE